MILPEVRNPCDTIWKDAWCLRIELLPSVTSFTLVIVFAIIAENQQWFQQELRPPMTEQWLPRCPPHLNGLKEARSTIHHDHFAGACAEYSTSAAP